MQTKPQEPSTIADQAAIGQRIPLWLKLVYTAFMAVLIPVYLHNYGPTNFLYFCDIALILTLIGIWTENKLLISMSAVGILVPQIFWVIDFVIQLLGMKHAGLTSYMFEENRSLFLRGLSLFHGWLPFLLVYLVAKLGYDRRAFLHWTILGWSLCLIAFFLLPPAGAQLADPKIPVNVNYVFGLDDAKPQDWLPAKTYLLVWMGALLALVYTPTHFALKKLFTKNATETAA